MKCSVSGLPAQFAFAGCLGVAKNWEANFVAAAYVVSLRLYTFLVWSFLLSVGATFDDLKSISIVTMAPTIGMETGSIGAYCLSSLQSASLLLLNAWMLNQDKEWSAYVHILALMHIH